MSKRSRDNMRRSGQSSIRMIANSNLKQQCTSTERMQEQRSEMQACTNRMQEGTCDVVRVCSHAARWIGVSILTLRDGVWLAVRVRGLNWFAAKKINRAYQSVIEILTIPTIGMSELIIETIQSPCACVSSATALV